MLVANGVWPFAQRFPDLELFSCGIPKPSQTVSHIGSESRLVNTVESRRLEFAAGRACAIAALKALGCEAQEVGIARPHRYPRFPPGFVGSISHSETWATACAARKEAYLSIGLDIERLYWHAELDEMARQVMTKFEFGNYLSGSGDAALLFFYLCFSIKESFFKAVFPLTHTWMDFTESEVLRWDSAGHVQMRILSSGLSSSSLHATVFDGLWSVHHDCILTLLPIPRSEKRVS